MRGSSPRMTLPGRDEAKQKPRLRGRGFNLSANAKASVALSEQLQEQREQVDEVQIQRQRAGNGGAFGDVAAGRGVAVDVLILQPLGIPGGRSEEHTFE